MQIKLGQTDITRLGAQAPRLSRGSNILEGVVISPDVAITIPDYGNKINPYNNYSLYTPSTILGESVTILSNGYVIWRGSVTGFDQTDGANLTLNCKSGIGALMDKTVRVQSGVPVSPSRAIELALQSLQRTEDMNAASFRGAQAFYAAYPQMLIIDTVSAGNAVSFAEYINVISNISDCFVYVDFTSKISCSPAGSFVPRPAVVIDEDSLLTLPSFTRSQKTYDAYKISVSDTENQVWDSLRIDGIFENQYSFTPAAGVFVNDAASANAFGTRKVQLHRTPIRQMTASVPLSTVLDCGDYFEFRYRGDVSIFQVADIVFDSGVKALTCVEHPPFSDALIADYSGSHIGGYNNYIYGTSYYGR